MDKPTIDLSIIILSYNTKSITQKCLDTIYKQTPYSLLEKTEVIILDNHSSDSSVSMLKEYKAKINKKYANSFILILSKKNFGYAKGNNMVVSKSHGKYLLFLNSDIEIIDNGIQKLFHYYLTSPYEFVGAKLFNTNLTPQTSTAPFYSLAIVVFALFFRGDYIGITRNSPNIVKKVDWVSGACFITKKQYFEKIHGFDESIFMYMDEVDLLYRANKIGMKTGFYPDAHFIHHGSASSLHKKHPILQVYKGLLYFYKKHHTNLELRLLKILLQLKAYIAKNIGYCTHNQYLIETYEEASIIIKKG